MHHSITLIDKKGNAYPVAGCVIEEQHEGSSYWLFIINHLGANMRSLARDSVVSRDAVYPSDELIAVRNRIVKALIDGPDVLDLREPEHPDQKMDH